MTIVLIIRRDAGMADNKKITSAMKKETRQLQQPSEAKASTVSKASAEVKAKLRKTEAAIEKELKKQLRKLRRK